MIPARAKTGLVLPGGGARGAYQVGVLKALAEFLPSASNPFPIMAGTSAGAINATVMASHAENVAEGAARLEQFWAHLRCQDVYRTGWLHNLATGAHWLASMTLGGLGVANPKSLLDNQPLASLLKQEIRTDGIQQAIENGDLEALLITASGYATARAVTFIQAAEHVKEWHKAKRTGQRTRIQPEHLLASAALPLLFPAQLLGNEYFGDGGMRHTTPLSPAIRSGADQLLIIGTRDARPDSEPSVCSRYPSLGDIGGYLLDVIFMDYLSNDLDRLQRINRTLSHMSADQVKASGLKPIKTVFIQPSKDIREISDRHRHRVPASVKTLLKGVGAWGPGRLPSYLLFEAEFCQELIELGYKDGLAARESVEDLILKT